MPTQHAQHEAPNKKKELELLTCFFYSTQFTICRFV